jgi:4-diphosphocytidyl-2-C-methyl-D-erythritol kinase
LEQLVPLAAELGSDVPFFLAARPAMCRGRGEIVEEVSPLGRLHFVVVRPPAGLSTAAVYQACRPSSPTRRVEPLIAALRRGDARRMGRLLCNRLQPAAAELSPWIGRLETEFAAVDCPAAQMSGSGTSYFGICRSAVHARGIAAQLRSRGVGQVYAVETVR